MYKALVDVVIVFGGEQLHLTEGALYDLKTLQPGEIDFLLAAEYVAKAKGTKAKAATPEDAIEPPETR